MTDTPAIAAAPDADPPGPAGPSTLRVLVVDDHRDAADALAALLQLEIGCAVLTAYDGEAALHSAASWLPHAIVIDIHMPGMSGVAVARALRGPGSAPDGLLLLAVTGRAAVAEDLEIIDGQFDRAFAKPVNLQDLASVLTRHWQERPLRREHTPFELGELFTRAAREVLPALIAKQQMLSFDCDGPAAVLVGDAAGLHSAFHRLFMGLIDVMGPGFAMFTAQTLPEADGSCMLEVNAAGAGEQVSLAGTDAVIARLGLVDAPRDPQSPPNTREANGECPNCGGRVSFSVQPNEGVLFRLTLRVHPVEMSDEAADAGDARAWVVNHRDVPAALLKRRLQRLGWRVRRFSSCADAVERLGETGGDGSPALIVVREGDGSSLADAGVLQSLLRATTPCVFLVVAGSQTLRNAPDDGCDVRIEPLSPRELGEMTQRASERDTGSGGPTTLSRGLAERPHVLVVDDNEVNRIVAMGLVRALGYEASAVSDGLDAIERCKVLPPDLVLMDVNMPVLDGIVATLRIRELQRLGRIAPFAIVAATASTDPDTVAQCIAAGMDGFLCKPLHLKLLQQELRRVTAGRASVGG